MTAKDEIGSFDTSVRPAKCSSCGAEIVWCKTLAGKSSPMQADPSGTWIIVDGVMHKRGPYDQAPFYVSHFALCPQARSWRKRK